MVQPFLSEATTRHRVYLLAPHFADFREWESRGLDAVPVRAEPLLAMLFQPPDALVVDVDGLDGANMLEECWQLRDTLGTPLFVVAPRMDSTSVMRLLRRGAVDVIVEPPSSSLLAARVSAFLRRSVGRTGAYAMWSLRFCGVELDFGTHTVRSLVGNAALTLTEFNLLIALLRANGRTCTHAELNTLVWQSDRRSPTGNMRLVVARLRKKLGDDTDQPHIVLNTRGIGYRIAAPPECAACPSGRRAS